MIVGAERRMEGGCEDAFTVSVLRKWKETRASEPLEDCGPAQPLSRWPVKKRCNGNSRLLAHRYYQFMTNGSIFTV